MSMEDFLKELRRAQLDNRPVTVEAITQALARLTDPTFRGDEGVAIGILRGAKVRTSC